jgi:hypothetical protein
MYYMLLHRWLRNQNKHSVQLFVFHLMTDVKTERQCRRHDNLKKLHIPFYEGNYTRNRLKVQCSSYQSLFLFGSYKLKFRAGDQLTCELHNFSQHLQRNARIVLKLGYDISIPQFFKSIRHQHIKRDAKRGNNIGVTCG